MRFDSSSVNHAETDELCNIAVSKVVNSLGVLGAGLCKGVGVDIFGKAGLIGVQKNMSDMDKDVSSEPITNAFVDKIICLSTTATNKSNAFNAFMKGGRGLCVGTSTVRLDDSCYNENELANNKYVLERGINVNNIHDKLFHSIYIVGIRGHLPCVGVIGHTCCMHGCWCLDHVVWLGGCLRCVAHRSRNPYRSVVMGVVSNISYCIKYVSACVCLYRYSCFCAKNKRMVVNECVYPGPYETTKLAYVKVEIVCGIVLNTHRIHHFTSPVAVIVLAHTHCYLTKP